MSRAFRAKFIICFPTPFLSSWLRVLNPFPSFAYPGSPSPVYPLHQLFLFICSSLCFLHVPTSYDVQYILGPTTYVQYIPVIGTQALPVLSRISCSKPHRVTYMLMPSSMPTCSGFPGPSIHRSRWFMPTLLVVVRTSQW